MGSYKWVETGIEKKLIHNIYYSYHPTGYRDITLFIFSLVPEHWEQGKTHAVLYFYFLHASFYPVPL